MFLCSRGHCPLSDSRRTAGSSVVRAKRVEALYKSHNTASLPCRGPGSNENTLPGQHLMWAVGASSKAPGTAGELPRTLHDIAVENHLLRGALCRK